jgi:hypothetical protein
VYYTRAFSGTSSASPIVVGAVGAYQGIMRARGTPRTPAQVRTRLRTTGSPQQDAPGRPATQRIGNRPNLRALVGKTIVKEISKEIHKEKLESKEIKIEKVERKEIKERKLEKPERKELKEAKLEGKEIKEAKLEKNELKEQKLEKVEQKELEKIKPEVEGKQIREKINEKLSDKLAEGGGGLLGGGGGVQGAPPESVDDRLDRIEGTLAELFHFIGGDLRPDLGQGALSHESDIADLEAQLDQQAGDAKDAKDMKDIEKMSEV